MPSFLLWAPSSLICYLGRISRSRGQSAFASTTGTLNGCVTEATTKVLVARAKVTVASPSQTAVATTDASGRYTFVSLSLDTYVISVEKEGFGLVSQTGIDIIIDHEPVAGRLVERELKRIARVAARSSNSLIRSSTTFDVYSVNAATQGAVQGMGGGANIDNAYSALASTPGVKSAINNSGWGQTLYIHGSSYSQVGYGYDGIPCVR